MSRRPVPFRRAEVIEECGGVGICRVDLIPQACELAAFDVARQQSRFARTRRGCNPDGWMLSFLVEQGKKALARHRVVEPRPRQLGQLLRFFRHSLPLPKSQPFENQTPPPRKILRFYSFENCACGLAQRTEKFPDFL